MPQCFDVNNNVQDCAAASDSGGSSCFDDNAQEVSCSEVGGYGNALGNVTASQVGATAAGGGSSQGPSALSSIFTTIGSVGTQIAATVTGKPIAKPPSSSLLQTGGSSSNVFLILAVAAIAFFAFGLHKKTA